MINPIRANNPVWMKNIEALRRSDSDLLRLLSQTELDPAVIKYAHASDGSPVIGKRQPDGRYIAFDDLKNPTEKTDQWVLNQDRLDLRHGHIMLVGIGSGYHALSIYKLSDDDTFIWVVEPDPAVLKSSFHILDFSELLLSERVRFISGCSPEETIRLPFDGVTGNRMRAIGIQLHCFAAGMKEYREYIDHLKTAIQNVSQNEVVKLKTMEAQGRYVLRNCVSNLSAIIDGAPFLRLLNAAPGVPALVVGPGPGLQESVDKIKSIQDQVIVIAVDTALGNLQRNGVSADLIVSVDFTDLNARHFEGILQDKSVLVASPSVHPQIIQKFSGRSYFFSHHAIRLINEMKSIKVLGAVDSFGSTAHAAYHIARQMGCSPIILTGLDFAFCGDRQYADGAMQNDLDLPRRDINQLYEVAANDGSLVKTSMQFKMFLDSLASMIKKTYGQVINTSTHGARIAGVEFSDFDEVISALQESKIDKSFLLDSLNRPLTRRIDGVISELIGLLDQCNKLDVELTNLIDQMEGLDASGEKSFLIIKQSLELFLALQKDYDIVFRLCSSISPRATILLFGDPGCISRCDKSNVNAIHLLKNKLTFSYSDFRNAVRQYAKYFNVAVASLNDRMIS